MLEVSDIVDTVADLAAALDKALETLDRWEKHVFYQRDLLGFIHQANPDQSIRASGFRHSTHHEASGLVLGRMILTFEDEKGQRHNTDDQLVDDLVILDVPAELYTDYWAAIDNEYVRAVEKLEALSSKNKRNVADPKKSAIVSVEAMAIAVKVTHPDWTDKLVAETIGTHPKYLSRLKCYKAAKKAIKSVGAADIIRGERRMGKDGSFDLEAWDPSDG